MNSLKKFILGLLTFRVFTLMIAAFYPFSGPHEWRQYDTIGMAYRYFIEFFQSSVDKYPKILPAVLQAGDKLGVTPVEIPILNLITSPVFLLGNFNGITLANLLLLILNIQLTYLCYLTWKDAEVLEEKIEESFLLIPLISFSLIYFGKFMPDMLSVLLSLYALGLAVQKNKLLFATVIASIGLMMKPTSVIVYAIFLLMKERKLIKHYIWMGISILVTIIYYKIVNPAILNFAGEKSVFAVGTKPLGVAIQQFTGQPKLYFSIFLNSLYGKWIIIPFFILIIFNLTRKTVQLKKVLAFIGVIIFQSVFLHLLSGNHPYWHNYYYLGITPILCLLLFYVLKNSHQWAFKTTLVILFITVGLKGFYDLKPMFKPQKKREWQLRSECIDLKKKSKQFPWGRGYHFRSSQENFPILGMCFGEIQNATQTQFGFFYKDKTIPSDCQAMESSEHLVLVRCK